jgi:HAD superfamily hydrolase (TIGR01509 family)
MTIRAVIFDLDGVLIDSEICWQRAREAFAASHGATWTNDLQRQAMGTGSERWLALMQQHVAPQLARETIYADMIERMRSEYARALPLRDGAIEAVRALAGHYTIALASGAPSDLIDYTMTASGLGQDMATIVYGDTVTHGKPAPAIYNEAARRLNLPPTEAVGIEDSGNGLAALDAAGLWAIAAPVPGFEPTAGELARAHARIDRLVELTPALINGLTT